MKIVEVVILVLVASAAPSSIQDKWIEFKNYYKKQYFSPAEDLKRMAIFQENLHKIEEHNVRFKKGLVTHTKAMNKFGDMTKEEFLEFVNLGKIQKTKNTKNRVFVAKETALPEEVDWRSRGIVTAVKDQGQCGSCWSFSTTGALEAQLALTTGTLTSLSEQNLIDCSGTYGNAGCNGGWMDSAYEYVRDNGIETELEYPYEARLGPCRYNSSLSTTSLSSYYDIPSGNESSLLSAVATVGPVSVAVDATSDLQFYLTGVIYDDECDNRNLNHGVLVVGYGTQQNHDYWLVKNSWGEEWGERGYYKAARNSGNNCGIATAGSFPILQ